MTDEEYKAALADAMYMAHQLGYLVVFTTPPQGLLIELFRRLRDGFVNDGGTEHG